MAYIYTTLTQDPFNRPNENPVDPTLWGDDLSEGIPGCQIINDELVSQDPSESIAINLTTLPRTQFAQLQFDSMTGGWGPDEDNVGDASLLLVMGRTDASNGFAFEVDGNTAGTLGAACGVVIFSENSGVLTNYYGGDPDDELVDIFPGDSIRMELLPGNLIAAYVIHEGISRQILAPTPCDGTLTGIAVAIDLFDNTAIGDIQVSNFLAGSIELSNTDLSHGADFFVDAPTILEPILVTMQVTVGVGVTVNVDI